MPPYGIMFHHFYGAGHPKGQGAISRDDLASIIRHVGPGRILRAEDWLERALHRRLAGGEICLTFDDALRCQYDVARPVLEDFGLTAFWFVYSSVFQGVPERLEVYRYFRTVMFDDIDKFYDCFFSRVEKRLGCEYEKAQGDFRPDTYLATRAFYSKRDRFFRFLRDEVLGPERYNGIMDEMLEDFGFSLNAIKELLWMGDEHLRALEEGGHVVGLHSFSHPTRLERLCVPMQRTEYERNHRHLGKVLGKEPISMSHPCNSYSRETLEILRDLGIRVGFRADMEAVKERSSLEFAREDHANVLMRMNA